MGDEEILYAIPKVNPNTFNSYVNNYFQTSEFQTFLANLTDAQIQSLFAALLEQAQFGLTNYWESILDNNTSSNWTTSGSGTGYPRGYDYYVSGQAAINAVFYHWTGDSLFRLIYNKAVSFRFWLAYMGIVNVKRYVVLISTPASDVLVAQRCFGFYIVNARIHAISGDGGALTDVDTGVDIPTSSRYPTYFQAIFDIAGGKIDYYINQVLKATITTHLPELDLNYYFEVLMKTLDADPKDLIMSNNIYLTRGY